MKRLAIYTTLLYLFATATTAFANQPLDCSRAVALQLLRVMPAMGASQYAPGRYAFIRSTCGTAENGLYCLGRDYDERLQDPVHRQLARDYQQGLSTCGVPQDASGRWHTGEIRCRGDAQGTCRIFPPSPVPANWPRRTSPEPSNQSSTSDWNRRQRELEQRNEQWRYDQHTDQWNTSQRRDPPREQETSGSQAQQLNQIKAEALRTIDDAYARSMDSQIAQLKSKLPRAIINLSNDTPCGSTVAGCAEIGGNQMWLTAGYFREPFNQKLSILIHETAHLIGISDECACDRLVRKVFDHAGKPAEPSAYDEMCGVQ